MTIDPILPSPYLPLPPAGTDTTNASNNSTASERFSTGGVPHGVVVDISPEGWAAYNQNSPSSTEESGQAEALEAAQPKECQTCKNRKYQDDSGDSSVSFQAPTHISPGAAPSAVASHEREHVAHEQAKADRDDRRIVSQTVTLHTSICPECGRVYISGGVTRTLTAADRKAEQPEKTAGKNNI